MIIGPNFVFIHVPKSAGTSVTAALGGKSRGISTHTPLRCIDPGDRFTFGFIRNPWARMVSLYRFLSQKNFRRTDNFDQKAVRAMGFRRWLMDDAFIMAEDDHPEGEPWVMKTHWRAGGQVPLSDHPAAPDGRRVAAMQRRPQVWWLHGADYIGRVEDFPHSFHHAMAQIGRPNVTLPHANRTKGGDWRAEYDDETAAHIQRHFAEDIALGAYTFEG